MGFLAELQKGVEAFRLDALTAATQGIFGYFIAQAVDEAIGDKRTTTVVTRVLARCDDPAFKNPTKFIGPVYGEEEAKTLTGRYGWHFRQDPRGGWRRVVPSPIPIEIVEIEAIRRLIDSGFLVVAAGGGGIPTCDRRGVEGVVDKDLASALLAVQLAADILFILTDVDGVYINYRRPGQRKLDKVTKAELEKYLSEGHFPPGSMGPKVEAALYFLDRGGKRVAIGALEEGYEVFRGLAGMQITP